MNVCLHLESLSIMSTTNWLIRKGVFGGAKERTERTALVTKVLCTLYAVTVWANHLGRTVEFVDAVKNINPVFSKLVAQTSKARGRKETRKRKADRKQSKNATVRTDRTEVA